MRTATAAILVLLAGCAEMEGPLEMDAAFIPDPPPDELSVALETHDEKLMTMKRNALLAVELPQLDPAPEISPDLYLWNVTVVAKSETATLKILQEATRIRIEQLKSKLEQIPVSYEKRETEFRLKSALKLEEQKLELIDAELLTR